MLSCCVQAPFSGADEDAAGGAETASPQLRSTEGTGIALGLVGAAAIGAGVYLWWRDQHAGAPVAAITHDAALVGWSGSF